MPIFMGIFIERWLGNPALFFDKCAQQESILARSNTLFSARQLGEDEDSNSKLSNQLTTESLILAQDERWRRA